MVDVSLFIIQSVSTTNVAKVPKNTIIKIVLEIGKNIIINNIASQLLIIVQNYIESTKISQLPV